MFSRFSEDEPDVSSSDYKIQLKSPNKVPRALCGPEHTSPSSLFPHGLSTQLAPCTSATLINFQFLSGFNAVPHF